MMWLVILTTLDGPNCLQPQLPPAEFYQGLLSHVSDMEIWVEVRRRVLTGELSKRAACREYEIHWQTLEKKDKVRANKTR